MNTELIRTALSNYLKLSEHLKACASPLYGDDVVTALEALAALDKCAGWDDGQNKDAKDAARYRWIRDRDNFPAGADERESGWDILCDLDCREFDYFIDSFISSQESSTKEAV